MEGTKKYLIDFTLKADFLNLLSFLRDLEFQENIILLDDDCFPQKNFIHNWEL